MTVKGITDVHVIESRMGICAGSIRMNLLDEPVAKSQKVMAAADGTVVVA